MYVLVDIIGITIGLTTLEKFSYRISDSIFCLICFTMPMRGCTTLFNHDSFRLLCSICVFLAAGTVIGIILFIIIISVFFFIVLLVIVCRKRWKKTITRQEEPDHIYDYIDVSVPPQLPPRRLTTQENPAYEKVELNDCVAYSSKQSQEIEIKDM